MQKEISYTGMTTRPGNYDSPDGDLNLLMNLVNEDGNIKPIEKPSVLFSVPEGYDLVHIHKNKTYTNYILYRTLNESGHPEICYSQLSSGILSTPITISEVDMFLEAKSIGNILCLSSRKNISYALYSDGEYKYLGSDIPTPRIYFKGVSSNEVNNFDNASADIPFLNDYYDYEVSHDDMEDKYASGIKIMTDAVFGEINDKIADLNENGYLSHPFLIRYAVRLYDGTLVKHSIPILINPDFVSVLAYSISGDTSYQGEYMHIATDSLWCVVKKIIMAYYIYPDSNFTTWKDLISSIDIFITAPLYNYRQDKNVTGAFATYAVNTPDPNNKLSDTLLSNSMMKLANSVVTPADLASILLIPYKRSSDYLKEITAVSTFYKIASFSIDEIQAGHGEDDESMGTSYLTPEGNQLYSLKPKTLKTLTSQEVMTDDFRTNTSISAAGMYIYNNRLNIFDIATTLKGFLPQTYGPGYLINQTGRTAISVYVRKDDGQTAIVTSSVDTVICPFPVYFFFPEANAYKVIFENAGKTIEKQLESHPLLTGAYYLSDTLESEVITAIGTAPVESNTIIYAPNQIKLSEVNNPFSFLAANSYSVGNGEILNISSATKALSEGQFGQFPLYAFTSDGVWALEVSSTGTYSSKQPATRDVLKVVSVVQLDGAIAFMTEQGIMLLSGSTSECISLPIDEPVKELTLPKLSTVVSIPALLSFREFSEGCYLSFDYTHSRLVAFNPSYTYSYIFSMKSKTWSIVNESYSGAINSYPDSYLKKGRTIVNLGSSDELFTSGVVVSRPMKLDSGNLKTITQAIHRGLFNNGDVQTILYGSRDLINYSVVTSSANHKMNAHGSPYKYYVIVIKSTLTIGEHISGTSIIVEDKYNNKLR